MSQAEKPLPDSNPPPVPAATGDTTPREKTSGRVAFDARGNAVWEWRTGDKQFGREVSTTLVEKLEDPDLRIATTAIVKGPKQARPGTPAALAQVSESFNPYNHSAAHVPRTSAPAHPKGRSVVTRVVTTPPREPGPIRRLLAWMGFGGRG